MERFKDSMDFVFGKEQKIMLQNKNKNVEEIVDVNEFLESLKNGKVLYHNKHPDGRGSNNSVLFKLSAQNILKLLERNKSAK